MPNGAKQKQMHLSEEIDKSNNSSRSNSKNSKIYCSIGSPQPMAPVPEKEKPNVKIHKREEP